MKQILFSVLLGFSLLQSAQASDGVAPGEPREGWDFSDAAMIPVLNGGRIKPFDSYAREMVLTQTGSRSLKGWHPVDLVLSWLSFPKTWEERPFILVNRADVKRQLVLNDKQRRFSPKELLQSSALIQYSNVLQGNVKTSKQSDETLGGLSPGVPVTKKEDPREKELRLVLGRVVLFQNLVSGRALPVLPQVDAATPWKSLALIPDEKPSDSDQAIRESFTRLIDAYYRANRSAFEEAAQATRRLVESKVANWDSDRAGKLRAEELYNRMRPFLLAWIFYLMSTLLFLGVAVSHDKWGGRFRPAGFAFLVGGGILHIFGILLRSYISGRPPVTNMYESVVWVAFGALVFGLILYWRQRQNVVLTVTSALVTLGLIASDASPAMLDPTINPLVPVLRSNLWLTIHVLTITLGYAAFALSLGFGNVCLYQFIKKKGSEKGISRKITDLNQLSYRAMQFGVVLLAAGTILGGVWADYSWGRFWGWDPKEVWALVALLAYVAVLHGRLTGWVGQFGFAALSVICFTTVMMAWYGVNFVLGVGLHSYGFASGGMGYIMFFCGLQLAFVLGVAMVKKARAK